MKLAAHAHTRIVLTGGPGAGKTAVVELEIRLADGQTLDLCHIVGVSPHWVMLAVRDAASRQHDMAIEFVPFEMVRGVRIHTRHAEGGAVGFSQHHPPVIIEAERLLEAAMSSRQESA